MSSSTKKIDLLRSFIRHQLQHHRQHLAASASSHPPAPLIIGMQGPQGSGKTTIARQLIETCSKIQPTMRIACLSLDDLYLPSQGLQAVAQADPRNRLLAGRGQPGTHDIALGVRILEEIKSINKRNQSGDEVISRSVQLPVFDKSLHDGKGDRSQETVEVRTPPQLDVLLFEGWCVGFEAYDDDEELKQIYEKAQDQKQASSSTSAAGGSQPFFLSHPLEHLLAINNHLRKLSRAIYPYLDGFIQLVPSSTSSTITSPCSSSTSAPSTSLSSPPSKKDLSQIFTWRKQAEHAMKSQNGGRGMTDEQVEEFVARYMPAYELWDDPRNGTRSSDITSETSRTTANGGNDDDDDKASQQPLLFRRKGAFIRLGLDKQRDLLWVDRGDGKTTDFGE